MGAKADSRSGDVGSAGSGGNDEARDRKRHGHRPRRGRMIDVMAEHAAAAALALQAPIVIVRDRHLREQQQPKHDEQRVAHGWQLQLGQTPGHVRTG